jgi:hypothetical protein
MSWLLLLLLVPLITIPVVMLLGFAGCKTFGSTPASTEPAKDFLANGVGVDKIHLKWTHTSASAKFDLSRADEAGLFSKIKSDHDQTTFDDQGLADGRAVHYELVAKEGNNASSAVKTSGITKPKAPFDLEVTAEEATHVDVQWKNASTAKGVRFRLRSRRLPDEPAMKDHPDTTVPKGSAASLVDGREYELEVAALVTDSENGVVKDVASDPSTRIKANTWKRAFVTVLSEVDTVRSGSTLVQRIPSAALMATGDAIRLTLKGRPVAAGGLPAKLLQVYISQPSPAAGQQAWDPASDLTKVDFGPVVEITLDDKSLRSRKTPYKVESGKDLLIAFDVKAETPARDVEVTRSTINGATRWVNGGVSEASLPDRSATGYGAAQNRLIWIESIEVTAS